MPFYNEVNLKEWKDSEIITDSLWVIKKRDKSGKHDNFYHGNFIPQIPRQIMLRYTKKGDVIFDPFVGGGTTAYESEKMNRKFIGIDIQDNLINKVRSNIDNEKNITLIKGDSTSLDTFDLVHKTLNAYGAEKFQLAILHPPYGNIIKFSDEENDLSNAESLKDFLSGFRKVVSNTISLLEADRYLAVIIGDFYTKGEWVPLGFYCMKEIQDLGLKLKSIVVKNMEGNRAKQRLEGIWRYRALSSDYYIFKHEYILIFKHSS